MSIFTLAILLIITNLPWFMNLTFQIPMQYCSLKHQTLLLSSDTSKTEHHFCFGPDTSLFLELLITFYFSWVAFWTPSAWGVNLLVSFFFFLIHTVHGVLVAKILKWFAIPSSSAPHFVWTLHYDPFILSDPTWHGSWLHWVMQTLHHNKAVIHEGGKHD